MTFSLAGRCARTGMFGAAVSSSSPAVAARCAFARAGVGAACSQNITDPRLGPRLLDLLAGGLDADAALATVVAEAPHVAAPPADGRRRAAAAPPPTPAPARSAPTPRTSGADCVAAGNLLASTDVPAGHGGGVRATPRRDLGDRLVAALRARSTRAARRGRCARAAWCSCATSSGDVADLRVDWSEGDPIADLERLWEIYAPQLDAYVTRALDPTAAPSYGVPGDE